MKILLTNNALNHHYGSETWTYSMAKELSKKHDVEIFTCFRGLMSEKLSRFCTIVDDVDNSYNLALVNHLNCYSTVPKSVFRIFTSHSAWIDIEQFPSDADVCVGVSEETAKGNYPVIRNGINCEEFNSFLPINRTLKRVLYLSHPHYGGASREILREACKDVELLTINEQEFNMPSLINKADLVIGFGRGLLEAMACGRNVISADHRPYYMKNFCGGGSVDESNFDGLKVDNFTGRTKGQIVFDADRLGKEFEKYDPERGQWLRLKVLEEFNIKKTARQYLDLYERNIHRNCVMGGTGGKLEKDWRRNENIDS